MLKILSNNLFKGDKVIWMIYFFLCMISLVEIYSASSSLTYTQGHHWDPMIRQAGFLLIGLVIILVVHRIPCKYFKLLPFFLVPASVLLLLYVLFFGGTINGGNRWIDLGFLSFQPSEVAKAALIMSLAAVLSKTQNEEIVHNRRGTKRVVMATKGGYAKPFKICSILTLGICGLIFTENLSTALILFAVAVMMMYIGNIPHKLMLKGLLFMGFVGAVAGTTLLITPDTVVGKAGGRVLTWKHRLQDKLGIQTDADKQATYEDKNEYNLSENWQVGNANIAIANSNIIGLGPGNSVQRDFLSHAESDFIYAIIVEELGIFGALFVIFLYVALLIRVSKIANKCDKFFPAFLIMGLGILLVLQALINMGVAVHMLPVTGQPLPLISKGGTSIIITCFYFGVILSVSRYAEKVSESPNEPAEAVSKLETDEYFSTSGIE
ncbi:MAG: FtsW/RodA/SpoVE family cell cycle protein [Bacteroidaceae bacterium]|nr:FtsW/RodA/SpoVE family cell cycle protein [Bacteroidaceae bacterium]